MALSWQRLALPCALAALYCPGMAAGADCKCVSFRCRDQYGDHVYSTKMMLSQEAQWCVMNSTAYRPTGECRYCPVNCQDNVCECSLSSVCDMSAVAGFVGCLAAAACLLGIACVSGCHHFKQRHLVRSYETELPQHKLDAWERKKSISIALPCVGAAILLGGGLAMWFIRQNVDG
mmetsp:Transcript_45006/g.101291  ORF Transcript_45006/g.101291 Transcript_45006/m.101291 type:complete len:176 (-) Transcript_45006:224-751(-)